MKLHVHLQNPPSKENLDYLRTLFDENIKLTAGIDVWYQYPESEDNRHNTPPSSYPFHELENVVMSPHRAGGWAQSEKHRMEHLAKMLNNAARGEPMENLVDSERGY